MKNFKKNTFILLIISVILVYFLVKDNFIETVRLIRSANALWIFVAFALFYIYVLLETIILQLLVVKYKKDYKFKDTFKLMIMSKFFNGITPFASGGQPLQVYELNKSGIKTTTGTLIMIQTFLIFQFTIILLGVFSVFANITFDLFEFTPLMYWMTIIGFSLNIFIFLVVYIVSCNQKLNKKIYKFLSKIIDKYKFIKNKEHKKEKIITFLDEYYESLKRLKNNKSFFIKCIIIEIVSLLSLFLIPHFVFLALRIDYSVNIIITLIISTYIFIVGSYIPIPGGTGGIEYSYLTFFKSFVNPGALSSSLIIWRFVSYYAPVAIGGIVFNLFTKKRLN